METPLNIYFEKLVQQQEQEKQKKKTPYIGRVESPQDVCQTLWIPYFTGNRTATFDLNHDIVGFNDSGYLIGVNANCGTPYIIIPMPKKIEGRTAQDQFLEELSELVCSKINRPKNYPKMRAIKADFRLPIIVKCINQLVTKY